MWRLARHTCRFTASQDIYDEVAGKLQRKFGFSPRHSRLMTIFVEQQTERVSAISSISICRDPDDNRILAAAIDSKCSHLITGDSDLLVLKQFQSVTIMSPREFVGVVSSV